MSVRATDSEGNPIVRQPEQQTAGGGIGYDPYQGNTNQYTTTLGGGGGGQVLPNNAYVPPSYIKNGNIKINLSADETVAFTEDGHSVGIGKNSLLNRQYRSFGTQRVYKATIRGKEASNYFVVQIEKTHNNSEDFRSVPSPATNDTTLPRLFGNTSFNFNLSFNSTAAGRTNPPTLLDILHKENIVIKEYELEKTSTSRSRFFRNKPKYKLKSERRIHANGGVINLNFGHKTKKLDLDITPQPDPQKLEYEVNFSSNLQNELGEKVNLEYRIITPSGQFLKQGSIKLSDNNNDLETIESLYAKDAEVHFKIFGDIGNDYIVKSVKYSTNSPNKRTVKASTFEIDQPFEDIAGIPTKKGKQEFNIDGLSLVKGFRPKIDDIIVNNIIKTNNEKPQVKPDEKTTENWKEVGLEFTATAAELLSNIHIHIEFEKIIIYPKPELSLPITQYEKEIKDSDIDSIFNLMFGATNADVINVYVSAEKIIKVEPSKGFVEFSFNKDFDGKYGTKRIILVPESSEYGTGERYEVTVNFKAVNDFPSITEIIHPQTIDIPSFSDGNISWDVEYETFAATTVDVDLILKDKTKVSLYKSLSPKGSFNINIRDLAIKFPGWNGNDNVTLIFKPYNRGGAEELIGNDYEIKTTIIYPSVKLDEDIIRKSIYDAFIEKLKFQEPEKEGKYLTHLVNLGNDEKLLISSWENDNWTLSEKGLDELDNEIVTKEVKSVIVKLYSPLPENIQVNQTIWISKMMTNPLVETIILNEQEELECPPIKGPNFDIEVDYVMGRGTDYESLDNLILSSSSNTSLIETYLSQSNLDTSALNIQYATGEIVSGTAQYEWPNFVHFSSAEERVNNFVYKVQLIENYETLLVSASVGAQTASLAGQQEIQRQQLKKSELIKGFDGFETFLYTSSSMWSSTGSESMTWPYSGSVRLPSTNSKVIAWYDRVAGLATKYDVSNSNWLINNIPQYIRINSENENFLLFFSMIGHYFDSIYYYTKAIERSRGLGYKSEAGLADKLLYDWLKGFSWDAIPLGSDTKLWDYALGLDENGNTRETTSAKKRTNEVWRRIINNLPYLLKHKGTRKGIYALMACYGVPSCNFSVMEFGGPEQTDEFKNKVLIDNCSYALKLKAADTISIASNASAKTFEAFVKPAAAGNYTLISSPTVLRISGSVGSEYGKISWGGHTSDLLPLFNGRYFGICISNTNLYVAQTEGDRIIFSYSASSVTAAPTSATITGFSGSIDEIRVWNQPLSQSIFLDHVFYPEMINGNHISASTTDLDLRLDFEYPKNLQSKTWLLNTAPGITLNPSSSRNYYEDTSTTAGVSKLRTTMPITVSVSGFSSTTEWPYQFEALDRNSMVEIPDIGVSRYSSNKIRFEEQSLISYLSPKNRATKKSFDQSPLDTNRVGIFFSPTKELNFDIAKSMGAEALNEYIGDPSDRYKPTYKKLNELRNYYFSRIKNRNIYEYIDLVRMYEKAMFDDLKKMLPARVKATTGLLIEPHFLERSKYEYEKPTGSNNYYEGEMSARVDDLFAENNQFESVVNADMSEQIFGENNYFEGPIDADLSEEVFGENEYYESEIDTEKIFTTVADYYYYNTEINAKIDEPTIFSIIDINGESKLVQSDPYSDIGFGIYCQNGHAIRTYFDEYGRRKKERILANIVTERKLLSFEKYRDVYNGKGDPRGGFIPTSSYIEEKKLVITTWSGSTSPNTPTVGGDITSVSVVSGYLPTHNRNTSDLTTGLINSYYKGSKNTSATTLDGTPPVEVFTTNPAAIKVKPGGTDSSEPIILVE